MEELRGQSSYWQNSYLPGMYKLLERGIAWESIYIIVHFSGKLSRHFVNRLFARRHSVRLLWPNFQPNSNQNLGRVKNSPARAAANASLVEGKHATWRSTTNRLSTTMMIMMMTMMVIRIMIGDDNMMKMMIMMMTMMVIRIMMGDDNMMMMMMIMANNIDVGDKKRS